MPSPAPRNAIFLGWVVPSPAHENRAHLICRGGWWRHPPLKMYFQGWVKKLQWHCSICRNELLFDLSIKKIQRVATNHFCSSDIYDSLVVWGSTVPYVWSTEGNIKYDIIIFFVHVGYVKVGFFTFFRYSKHFPKLNISLSKIHRVGF